MKKKREGIWVMKKVDICDLLMNKKKKKDENLLYEEEGYIVKNVNISLVKKLIPIK